MMLLEIEKSMTFLQKIEDPVLAILLMCLISAIVALWKKMANRTRQYSDLIKAKDEEIKSLNGILREDEVANRELLTELKNSLDRFLESDKSNTEIIRRGNELLIQLIVKIENTLQDGRNK